MLYYKVIGSMSLLVSGLWVYSMHTSFQKRKLKQLDAYIKLISHIKTQIECYMLPINSIIGSCSLDLLKNCGIDDPKRIKDLKELLNCANLILEKEIIELLYQFAEDFGMGYREEQLNSCERVISKMMTYRDEFQKKHEKDKRVSLAICMSLTLSLILILI